MLIKFVKDKLKAAASFEPKPPGVSGKTEPTLSPMKAVPAPTCNRCHVPVSEVIVEFCRQRPKFEGKTYCRGCQLAISTIQSNKSLSTKPIPHERIATPEYRQRLAEAKSIGHHAAQKATHIAGDIGVSAKNLLVSKYLCAQCDTEVDYEVVKQCAGLKEKFEGKVFCERCQRLH